MPALAGIFMFMDEQYVARGQEVRSDDVLYAAGAWTRRSSDVHRSATTWNVGGRAKQEPEPRGGTITWT